MTLEAPFTVIVPASTSNLGSGFDTVSAALSLYLRVSVEPSEEEGIRWVEGWDSSQENILDASLRSALQVLGTDPPPMRIRMTNPIPLKRGLGSSAAAIVAGIRIAEQVTGVMLSDRQRLDVAYPLEGHPDNLAASFFGGWVLSWTSEGKMHVEKLPASLSCRFVVAVPELTVPTREARAILPESYTRADAVYNVQRCALLVHALHRGRKDLLREATRDRLHQPYRSSLVPGIQSLLETGGLKKEFDDSLLAIAISGSGSAVIALADGHYDDIGRWMVSRLAESGTAASYRILDLDAEGVRVSLRA